MREKELDRYREWVVANVPLLAMRDASEVTAVIKRAFEDTQGVRVLVSVAGGLLGGAVGVGMASFIPIAPNSRWSYIIVVTLSAALFSYLFSIAGEVLVHRKIKSLIDR